MTSENETWEKKVFDPKKRKSIHDGGTADPTSEDPNKTEEKNDSSDNENSQQTESSEELTGEEISQNDPPTDVTDFPRNIDNVKITAHNRKSPTESVREKNNTPEDHVEEKQNNQNENDENKKQTSWLSLQSVGIMLVFIIGVVLSIICRLPNETVIRERDIDISPKIKEIAKTYPIRNEEVWDYLQTGIERLINKEKEPAIFVLVQWLAKNDTAYKIAYSAGDIVAKNLGSSNSPYNPVVLDQNILNSYDRGDVISLYKNNLKNQHVLIVNNIEQVVPEIAQDFRYYCDEDNPIVANLVIFFILNADRCENIEKSDIFEGSMKETIDALDTCLTKMWGGENGLDDSILPAVLSRVLTIALPIQET